MGGQSNDAWLKSIGLEQYTEAFRVLPALRVNTLVMHGKEDKLVGLDASRYLAREIAGASLYCFDGAGHLPTWTATEEFCQQIRKFLKTKPVGATSAEVTEWAADDQPLEFNP